MPPPRILRPARSAIRRRWPAGRLVFAFTGGGGGRPGLGAELYARHPALRGSVEETAAVIVERTGFDPLPYFRAPAGAPLVTREQDLVLMGMTQLALFDMWTDAGVQPDAVAGLSLGEVGAAYAAGALTRTEAAMVFAAIVNTVDRRRPTLLFEVAVDLHAARRLCRLSPVPLVVGGTVAPELTVAQCDAGDAEAARAYLGERAALGREYPSAWPYHSTWGDYDLDGMARELSVLDPQPPRIPIHSSVCGGRLPGDARLDGAFWAWMVSRPFRFAEALAGAFTGAGLLVTVGTHPVMPWILANPGAHDVAVVESLTGREASRDSWRRARRAVARVRRPRGAVPARGPVRRLPDGSVVVTGHAEVRAVLADAATYSSSESAPFDPIVVGADGAAHAAGRRAIAGCFSAERVDALGTLAERTAHGLLDDLVDRAGWDVVGDFAEPVSRAVAGEVLGLEPEAAALAAVGTGRPAPPEAHAAELEAFEDVAARSALFAQLTGDGGLPEPAARSVVRLLWHGATRTSPPLLAACAMLLLDRPELGDEVRTDPELLPALIAEAARLHPPERWPNRRAVAPATLAGVPIPAGTLVRPSLGDANRDPAVFPDPDEPRLGRPGQSLAFGAGPHRCPGARLGRLTVRRAVAALLERAPDLRSTQPAATRHWIDAYGHRALEALYVTAR